MGFVSLFSELPNWSKRERGNQTGIYREAADMDADELLRRYATGNRDFMRIDLAEVNLSSANLIGIDLSGAILAGAK